MNATLCANTFQSYFPISTSLHVQGRVRRVGTRYRDPAQKKRLDLEGVVDIVYHEHVRCINNGHFLVLLSGERGIQEACKKMCNYFVT